MSDPPDADDIGLCICEFEMCWCTNIVTFSPEIRAKVLAGEDYLAPCKLCSGGQHLFNPIFVRCPTCQNIRQEHDGFGPPHYASVRCQSGGHEHCSCDVCF